MTDADTWPPLVSAIDATPRVRRKKPEDKLHVSVWRALGPLLMPEVVCWSVENRNLGAKEGQRRKARGAIAGCPDMQVMWAPGRTAFIELKAGRAAVSPEQRRLHNRLAVIGISVGVCRSIGEVTDFLRAVGCPMRRTS